MTLQMKMIDKTKKIETTYMKSLKDKFEASLKLNETISLVQSLTETEETFRNPNLLIESIRDMQRRQEKLIAELKVKLNEQSQVKVNLIQMNKFIPNLSFSPDSFGQLHLIEYSSNDPFKSQILSDNQPSELLKLCEFSSNNKWTLLYKSTRDGFRAADFHSKCVDRNNTLTILKAHGSSYIFGGFTSIGWNSSGQYKSDLNAFLFSLTNKDNQPCKMRQLNANCSIYFNSGYGPTFGAGHDIYVCDNANVRAGSYTNLGHSYEHPQPSQGLSYLAGSYHIHFN
jgi:hypothetical protein